MPTHAELTAKLLNDAADFFLTLGAQNAPLMDQMQENADVFRQMAELIAQDPQGTMGDTPISYLAGRLLKDSAVFFTTLANQNEPIRDQMLENASVYDQMGDRVSQDPLGILG